MSSLIVLLVCKAERNFKSGFLHFPTSIPSCFPLYLFCAMGPLWSFGEAHGLRMLLNASNEIQNVTKDTDYVDINLSRHFLKL